MSAGASDLDLDLGVRFNTEVGSALKAPTKAVQSSRRTGLGPPPVSEAGVVSGLSLLLLFSLIGLAVGVLALIKPVNDEHRTVPGPSVSSVDGSTGKSLFVIEGNLTIGGDLEVDQTATLQRDLDVDGVLVCKTWETTESQTVALSSTADTSTLNQSILRTLNLRQRYVLVGTRDKVSYEWKALNVKASAPSMLPNAQVFTPDQPWELIAGDTSLYHTTPFTNETQQTIAWLQLPEQSLWTFVFQVQVFSSENPDPKMTVRLVVYTSNMMNVTANGLDQTDSSQLYVTDATRVPQARQTVYTGFATAPIPSRNTFQVSKAIRPMLEFATFTNKDVASVTYTITNILLYAFQQG